MAPNRAPIIAARVLLRHGLADDVVESYVARTWTLDDRQCAAAVQAARFLVRQEAIARNRSVRRLPRYDGATLASRVTATSGRRPTGRAVTRAPSATEPNRAENT
jgi:hypothetical protein